MPTQAIIVAQTHLALTYQPMELDCYKQKIFYLQFKNNWKVLGLKLFVWSHNRGSKKLDVIIGAWEKSSSGNLLVFSFKM